MYRPRPHLPPGSFRPPSEPSSGSIPNPECVTLKVTNRDPSAALSLDCLHQGDRCFWATCEPSVLEAGQSLDVPLHFAPRDARQYAFGVPFLVNGSYTVKLLVVGEGCPARLELANLAQKHLTFGMVPEGQQVAKQVRVREKERKRARGCVHPRSENACSPQRLWHTPENPCLNTQNQCRTPGNTYRTLQNHRCTSQGHCRGLIRNCLRLKTDSDLLSPPSE